MLIYELTPAFGPSAMTFPEPLDRIQKHGMRLAVVEGAFATVHIAITLGAFTTGLALFLGASDFQIGLLASLTPLSSTFSLAGAYWISSLGRRKPLAAWSALLGRSLYLPLVLLPFLPLLGGAKMALFLAVIAVSNIALTLSGNAWTDWMTDLVPLERRGRYFGIRSTLLGVVSMATNLAAGKALDHYKAQGSEATGFLIIFSVAVFFAFLAFLVLLRQPEPKMAPRPRVPLRELATTPFQDKDFRSLVLLFSFWAVATGLPAGYFGAHFLKNLHGSFSGLAFYSIVAGLVSLPAQLLWGRLIDRMGNKPVLIASILGVTILPLFWFFAWREFLFPIWVDAFLSGIFWPGIALSSFNLLLVSAKEENRAAYLAVFTTITGVTGFLASLLGGTLATLFSFFIWKIGPVTLLNFHILFLLSALGRVAVLFFMPKVKEAKAKPLAEMMRFLTDYMIRRFSLGSGQNQPG